VGHVGQGVDVGPAGLDVAALDDRGPDGVAAAGDGLVEGPLRRVLERSDLDYYGRARNSAKLDQMRMERLRTDRGSQSSTERGRISRDRKHSVMIQS